MSNSYPGHVLGRSPKCKLASLSAQVYFKSPLVTHSLTAHWPKQVRELSPELSPDSSQEKGLLLA